MFALDGSGPKAEAAARFLQLKLLEQVDLRSERRKPVPAPVEVKPDLSKRAVRADFAAACVKLVHREQVAKLERLVRGPAFRALGYRVQRTLIAAVGAGGTDEGQLAAAEKVLDGEGFRALESPVQKAFVDALRRLAGYPARRELLATAAALPEIAALPRPLQLRLVEQLAGPAPRPWSDPSHARELGRWWSRQRGALTRLLQTMAGAEASAVARALLAYLDAPGPDLWLLSSIEVPGAYLACFGDPADPTSLAFVRLIALDARGRMSVRVKSPVEPIRQGWSPRVDPEGVCWRYARYSLSRRESLGLIRWIEDNHRIEGAKPRSGPGAVGPATLYESALQFDLRLPEMVEVLTAHRGPLEPEVGEMVRGQPRSALEARVA